MAHQQHETSYPSRFPQPISNRSDFRIWRMCTSVTISNRRVRTLTCPLSYSARELWKSQSVKLGVNDALCGFDVSVGLLWLYESSRYTVSPQFYFI